MRICVCDVFHSSELLAEYVGPKFSKHAVVLMGADWAVTMCNVAPQFFAGERISPISFNTSV